VKNETRQEGKRRERKRNRKGKERGDTQGSKRLLSLLWKHVAVGKGLMAAYTHDVWLIVRRKITDDLRKQAAFLPCSPVRTMFMKKFNQSVLIMEGEGISSFILPTDVH
jgi:hypothetical protein